MFMINISGSRLVLRRSAQRQNPFQTLSKRPTHSLRPTDSVKNIEKTIPSPNTFASAGTSVSIWQRLGPLSTALRAYGRAQETRPYITQLVSSLVIYVCGDISAQSIGGEGYDPWRTVRAMIIGGVSSIPSYKWFMFLGESFNYSSKILSLSTKVIVNQLCFTPIFNSYFFGSQALLSGEGPAEALERIKRAVPTSFWNSCRLWPAVTAFNFTFISPQYRNVFAGFIAIGWQTYLSYLNQRAAEEERAERSVQLPTSEPLNSPTP